MPSPYADRENFQKTYQKTQKLLQHLVAKTKPRKIQG